jgi:haloacetate dehalogenase
VEHDRADRAQGRRIGAPLLAVWEQPAGVELPFDPLEVWRRWADDVRGGPLDCGHFLPEERPDELARAIEDFLEGRYPATAR